MSCQVVTLNDKKYPRLLKKIGKSAPKQLYYKGSWPFGAAQDKDDIFENCLAVVGSRMMTSYGKRATEQIVTEAAAAGITIVSGFMYGVDAAAHKAALLAGGKTIAVMPCGIDLIHPEYQQDLYMEILNSNGLIISEYEGDMQPANWTYPQRNRIVAGLSKAVLIIEAAEKSGSLITANLAKRFERKVFAVPGPITSETSKGTLQLLKEGASLATSAKDILDYYKVKHKVGHAMSNFSSSWTSHVQLSEIEGKILEQLKREPLEVDELARIIGMSVSKLGAMLSMMQLRGMVKQENSKYYVEGV